MTVVGGSQTASARACGPGWHLFEPPVAVGYFSGEEWVETVELPMPVGLSDAELADYLADSGADHDRIQETALDLVDTYEILDEMVLGWTSKSSFTNAFMRAARADFQTPIATIDNVELVQPKGAFSSDESYRGATVIDSGSIVVSVEGAVLHGMHGTRTIRCGRVRGAEFSIRLGTMYIDGLEERWFLRNLSPVGAAVLFALQYIDPDIALRGTVRYVSGWLDAPKPDPDDVADLRSVAARARELMAEAGLDRSTSQAPTCGSSARAPEAAVTDLAEGMPIVDFFLDEDTMPMPLCVVHDVDGPDEFEVWLGTFANKPDAMSAVDTVRKFLQEDAMRWSSVPEALNAAQFIALRCRGNLGLPDEATSETPMAVRDDRPDLASQVLASTVFAAQRERAHRLTLTDHQIGSLLRMLAAAPGHRIGTSRAAAALGIPLVQVNGALPTAQRLLNVEQFPVLERDAEGGIVLDVDLLREQFGVGE